MDNEESNKVKLECYTEESFMSCFIKGVLVSFLPLLPSLAFAEGMVFAPINLTEGNAQNLIPDTTDWTSASINLPIAAHNFSFF
jgi:hypothetical protein